MLGRKTFFKFRAITFAMAVLAGSLGTVAVSATPASAFTGCQNPNPLGFFQYSNSLDGPRYYKCIYLGSYSNNIWRIWQAHDYTSNGGGGLLTFSDSALRQPNNYYSIGDGTTRNFSGQRYWKLRVGCKVTNSCS